VEIYKGPSSGIAGRNTIGGAVNIISKQPDLTQNFYEVTTTFGTDNMFRTMVDVNQKVTPNFAVRANIMYDQHDVAGRDVTDSERWGGLISATGRFTESVTVTVDYYRYFNDATPDWGVPVLNTKHLPETEFGLPRNTWVGMKGLDFFKEKAEIVTAKVVAKLVDGVTLTNRSRIGESRRLSHGRCTRCAPSEPRSHRKHLRQSDRGEFPVQDRHRLSQSCCRRGGYARDHRQVWLQCYQLV
jgi:catecholate siderophore receptor